MNGSYVLLKEKYVLIESISMIPIQINRPICQYDGLPKKVPITKGPMAEAKTTNVVAILLIAPKCVCPYNSTHNAVADTDISATEIDIKHK